MDQSELISKITSEVMRRLQAEIEKQRSSAGPTGKFSGVNPAELAQYIDHTLLKPESTLAMFDKLCAEAKQYKFKSVCVNSCRVPYVTKKLQGTGVAVCSVIGFPLGAMDSRAKAFEGRRAIEEGLGKHARHAAIVRTGKERSHEAPLLKRDV